MCIYCIAKDKVCKMRFAASLFLLVILANLSQEETVNFDPYEVLGVKRTVSTDEIRKVYKKLVKEWHPDKNKSPDAQDKFIKIQQAYEILSNEDKREQYDTGGYSGDTVGQWHQHSEGFNFRYSDFGQDFFNTQGSSHAISVHDYYAHVLPASHLTPHLIYVYSTFCAQCILWLRTTWQKAASDLESLGVSICTVDTTFTSRIASSLGVNRIPTIVGLYREKVYYFKGEISKEELKFFVQSFLPSNLITRVTTASAKAFLSGVETDDKPRSILFSDKRSPTLLYTLMAIKYQHYLRFGFVDLRDEKANEFIKHFGVSKSGPTLLVFKENLEKPAVVLGASQMPRGAVNDILAANKFLVLPRLTSQKVFEELCPQPHGAVYTVRLCMILLSDPSYNDYKKISNTLKKLVSDAQTREENLSEWLKFMQVHALKQPAFARSLRKSVFTQEKEESKLFLVWRRGQASASLLAYDVDFLEKTDILAQQEFQLCLRTSIEAAHLQRFQATASLDPLVDELAPFFVMHILQMTVEVLEYCYNFVSSLSEKSFMTVVMLSVLFIFTITFLFGSDDTPRNPDGAQSAGNKAGADSSPRKASDVEQNETTELPKKKSNKFLVELEPSTYASLVLNQARGHVTVVLLADESTVEGSDVLQGYCESMKIHARDPKISVTYLNIEKYSSWYLEIRRSSTAEPPDQGDGAMQDSSTLHGSSEFDRSPSHKTPVAPQVTGTVLALNGARHWYCIFVPRGIKWDAEKKDTAKTNDFEAEGDAARTPAVEETYEEVLSCWMDRVREGQMPRLYVRQWPGLYVHPEEMGDDDDF